MAKRVRKHLAEIDITLEELQSFGRQLGIKSGPLSPILESDPGLPPVRIDNLDMVNKRGEPLSNVVLAFNILAKPEIAAGLICIAPETMLDVSFFSRYQDGEEHSVALYKGQKGLRLQSPAPKKNILTVLQDALAVDADEEASIELDATTSIGEAWVLWAVMDLLRPIEGEIPVDPEITFTTKQILEKLADPVQGMWNLAAYYREALELRVPKLREVNRWCGELTDQGFLFRVDSQWEASWLLTSIISEIFPLRSHVHFKMTAQAPIGGLGSVRLWGLQGQSGQCMVWYPLPDKIQFLSSDSGNLLDILAKLILQSEFVFTAGELRPDQLDPVPRSSFAAATAAPAGSTRKPGRIFVILSLVGLGLVVIACLAIIGYALLTGQTTFL
jgi:hypothetical protein